MRVKLYNTAPELARDRHTRYLPSGALQCSGVVPEYSKNGVRVGGRRCKRAASEGHIYCSSHRPKRAKQYAYGIVISTKPRGKPICVGKVFGSREQAQSYLDACWSEIMRSRSKGRVRPRKVSAAIENLTLKRTWYKPGSNRCE